MSIFCWGMDISQEWRTLAAVNEMNMWPHHNIIVIAFIKQLIFKPKNLLLKLFSKSFFGLNFKLQLQYYRDLHILYYHGSHQSHSMYMFYFFQRLKWIWPAPNLWVIIGQLVERCIANAEFLKMSFRNCLNCDYNRADSNIFIPLNLFLKLQDMIVILLISVNRHMSRCNQFFPHPRDLWD